MYFTVQLFRGTYLMEVRTRLTTQKITLGYYPDSSCLCRESDITKERIQKILATGANVILTTGGIDDMCLKYFVETGTMAVRRVLKRDLKRIAKASGGRASAGSQPRHVTLHVHQCVSWCWNVLTKQLQKREVFIFTAYSLNALCYRSDLQSHFSRYWKGS